MSEGMIPEDWRRTWPVTKFSKQEENRNVPAYLYR